MMFICTINFMKLGHYIFILYNYLAFIIYCLSYN